jgi:hypothetical protein
MSFALQLLGIPGSRNVLKAITDMVYFGVGWGGVCIWKNPQIGNTDFGYDCVMYRLNGKFFDSYFRPSPLKRHIPMAYWKGGNKTPHIRNLRTIIVDVVLGPLLGHYSPPPSEERTLD